MTLRSQRLGQVNITDTAVHTLVVVPAGFVALVKTVEWCYHGPAGESVQIYTSESGPSYWVFESSGDRVPRELSTWRLLPAGVSLDAQCTSPPTGLYVAAHGAMLQL